MAGEYVGTTEAMLEKASGNAFSSRPARVASFFYRDKRDDGTPVPLSAAELQQQKLDVAEWSSVVNGG